MTNQPVRATAIAKYYKPRLTVRDFTPRRWPAWLMLGLLRVAEFLPLRVSRAFGAALGYLMYATNAKRRRIARVNLRLCFPNLSESERRKLLRQHFRVSGQGYLDLGFLAWAPDRTLAAKIRVLGLEHLNRSLERGQSVILLTPHCVGVNAIGAALGNRCPFFSMIKSQRDPLINWLLNKGRTRYGSPMVTRKAGLRSVVRGLQQGMVFCYLPDEDFGPRQSVFAPFFGVPTATLTTLGRLAKLGDAVVIPCFARVRSGGRGYEVTLEAPLVDFPTASRKEDAHRMNEVLEHGIRRMPAQYMWTFKFFKTRPGTQGSFYPPAKRRRA